MTFHKGFFILCLIFFFLCCALGIWQIYRYHYKTNLLNTYQSRLQLLPKPFMLLSPSLNDLQFQPVAADGFYLNSMTMLQNRLLNGKVGFEVLTPLQFKDNKKLLLIDRGWIEKSNIKDITPITDEKHITGYIKLLNEYQFILGNNIVDTEQKPLVMQKIDLNEMSQITGRQFYPFVLRLDESDSSGFKREWVIVSVLPERHLMYAIQWFLLSLVLAIAYICFSTERVSDS